MARARSRFEIYVLFPDTRCKWESKAEYTPLELAESIEGIAREIRKMVVRRSNEQLTPPTPAPTERTE